MVPLTVIVAESSCARIDCPSHVTLGVDAIIVATPDPAKVPPGTAPLQAQVTFKLLIKTLCDEAVHFKAGVFTGVIVTLTVVGLGVAVKVCPGITMFSCIRSS
jgi:hypothetical protein